MTDARRDAGSLGRRCAILTSMTNSTFIRRATGLFGAAIALIAFSACGSDDSGNAAATTAAPADVTAAPAGAGNLDGRGFVSTSVEGNELVEGTRVSIDFEDGRLAMNAGCNTSFGAYSVTDGTLTGGPFAQTMMFCGDELSAQDAWLVKLLESSPEVTLDGDALTLKSADVTLELVDRTSAAVNALDGTNWAFESLTIDGTTTAAPDGAELHFAADSVSVATGCNTGGGDAKVTADTVTFGAMRTTLMACEGPGGDFEALLLPVLTGEFHYSLADDALTLTSGTAEMVLKPII